MQNKSVSELELPLNRDIFLRNLLRDLSGTLEEIVGLEEASGFISIVGQYMAGWINQEYCSALGTERLSFDEICDVLVDLKKRIEGDFYIISADSDKIVLGNRKCPFGDRVKDRQSLCMMTSNVFGKIASENLGYAGIELNKTIANGDNECLIVVHLNKNNLPENTVFQEYSRN